MLSYRASVHKLYLQSPHREDHAAVGPADDARHFLCKTCGIAVMVLKLLYTDVGGHCERCLHDVGIDIHKVFGIQIRRQLVGSRRRLTEYDGYL